MTIINDNYQIALECVYYYCNLTSYQTMPELFSWSPMHNYFICPEDIRVNDRHAPFLIMSFDHGSIYNTMLALTDHESMRIKKISQTTADFAEIISLN